MTMNFLTIFELSINAEHNTSRFRILYTTWCVYQFQYSHLIEIIFIPSFTDNDNRSSKN